MENWKRKEIDQIEEGPDEEYWPQGENILEMISYIHKLQAMSYPPQKP